MLWMFVWQLLTLLLQRLMDFFTNKRKSYQKNKNNNNNFNHDDDDDDYYYDDDDPISLSKRRQFIPLAVRTGEDKSQSQSPAYLPSDPCSTTYRDCPSQCASSDASPVRVHAANPRYVLF